MSTQGAYSAGIVVLGNDSLGTLENRGHIDTLGNDAWGMLVLGQDHDILNADAPGGGGVISTAGDRAHGIALGLQEAVIPPGIGIPPSAFDPASGSVTNEGSISTLGAEADAIHVFGNDVSITNRGTLLPLGDASSGVDVKGTQLTVTNEGSILAGLVDSEDVTGIRLVDATDAEVHNADDAEIRVGGDFASGVAGNGLLRMTLDNLGTIQADGADAAGVDLAGQDLQIDNGSDTDSAEVGATGDRAIGIRAQGQHILAMNHVQGSLGVEGVDGAALHLRGSDLFASNEGAVSVGADSAWGLLVEADASGAYLAENRGSIAIQGGGGPAAALALHNTSGASLSLTDDIGMSVCGGSPQGAGVINCGDIGLQRDAATGVSAEGISGSLIENFGTISGSGDDLTGMRVRPGAAGASDDFVTNFRDILLNGSGATGMSVQGDENTIVNGTGSIVIFPDEALPGDPFTTISAQIDIVASVEGKEVEDLPIGRIAVDGPGAVGIDVAGDDNTIAILGALGDELNSVVASGTGSVGIRLSGEHNRVINNGRVAGTAASVLGGAGSDIVVNGATLEGDVLLQGGNDTFQIEPGSAAVEAISVAGIVDGGDGVDTLA
ncbi:MAG TPA: hypothetical protein VNL37_03350, partial [Candidatus Polarisedimenticolia bacterium]|nr:hypothetical protein [Candidatus Polarisedimenticolia bacterium]